MNPDKKFLIFYVLAGHGMMVSGRQNMLINEFDPNKSFYKMW